MLGCLCAPAGRRAAWTAWAAGPRACGRRPSPPPPRPACFERCTPCLPVCAIPHNPLPPAQCCLCSKAITLSCSIDVSAPTQPATPAPTVAPASPGPKPPAFAPTPAPSAPAPTGSTPTTAPPSAAPAPGAPAPGAPAPGPAGVDSDPNAGPFYTATIAGQRGYLWPGGRCSAPLCSPASTFHAALPLPSGALLQLEEPTTSPAPRGTSLNGASWGRAAHGVSGHALVGLVLQLLPRERPPSPHLLSWMRRAELTSSPMAVNQSLVQVRRSPS